MKQAMLVIDPRDLSTTHSTLDGGGGRDLLSSATTTTTVAESGIKPGDSLRVGFKEPFLIEVKAPIRGFTECKIKVLCHDTIRDLVEKIEKETGKSMGTDFPREFLGAEDRTLLSFGIYKYLPNQFPQHTIYHNSENKKPSYHRIRKWRPPHLDDDKKVQIVVEFPDMPLRFPLMCKPTDTVSAVREAIAHKYHSQLTLRTFIKNGLFVLIHGGTGTPLMDDSSTLEERGIKSIEVFEEASFEIDISSAEAESLRVPVMCFQTIGTIKGKIRDATGIPIEDQRLIYKEWRLDDNKRRLVDYGIAKPVQYYSLYERTDGKNKRTFWGPPDEKFHILLLLASSNESTTEDHAPATKRGKTRLSNPYKKIRLAPPTADESDPGGSNATKAGPAEAHPAAIKEHDRKRLQITVEIADTMWRFPLTFQTADTIGTVRKGIIEQCRGRGWPFNQEYIKTGMFVLVFGTTQLEEESVTLGENGIRDTDFIQLFDKASFGIGFFAPEIGLSQDVEVMCCETVGMLKGKLQALTGIPEQNQHVQYSESGMDWLLDDDERHLLEYGIMKRFRSGCGMRIPQNPRILVASSRSLLYDTILI